MVNYSIRLQAVRERINDRRSLEELAQKYDVSPSTVSRWVSKYVREHGGAMVLDANANLEKEVNALRAEVRNLRKHNETLLKVLGLLTGETDPVIPEVSEAMHDTQETVADDSEV